MLKKLKHELFGDTGYSSINKLKAFLNALIIVIYSGIGYWIYCLFFI